ncbi:dTDP-4-dehydrorhamnose 3,5-epimerase family protein [Candidatus Daviesbacteria bacterium]|nr:dTDP-4-dehydrorhamnose 3,5-epimerase family protein [Candidatus Daviesbacteria bacterium]
MDIKPYIKQTKIAGLYKIDREIFWDNRGFFREVYHKDELEEALGYEFNAVQMNHSLSGPKVLRGIHPDPWDKLVYPLNGQVFIAIVDIDPKSPTFKQVETFNVDDNNRHGLFVRKGLGNSLCVLGQEAVHYVYLVTSYWDGHAMSGMRAVAYNDPDLNIAWPIKDPILSDKDKQNKTLREHYQKEYPNLFK